MSGGNGCAYAEVRDPGSNGSTVSIVMDTINGTLSFIVAGKLEGHAYVDQQFKNTPVYPAVSMERKSDEIEFMSYAPYKIGS